MADYSILKTQILNEIKSDPELKSALAELNTKIKAGSAKYSDVVSLSKKMGSITSNHLQTNAVQITDGLLGEFADEVLAPVYRSMQKTSLAASKQVQRLFNKKMGLGLNPADVPTDESRLMHIAERFKEAESLDTVAFLYGKGVAENIARGAVTDSLRANARALNDAGVETFVIREGVGCCAWCETVVGTYAIDDAPDDFWKTHKGCTCSIEYKSKNTHTRVTYHTDDKGDLRKSTKDI